MYLSTFIRPNRLPFPKIDRQQTKELLYGYGGLGPRIVDGQTQWVWRLVDNYKLKVLSQEPLKCGSDLELLFSKEVVIDDVVPFECHLVIRHLHDGVEHFTRDPAIINSKLERWFLADEKGLIAMPKSLSFGEHNVYTIKGGAKVWTYMVQGVLSVIDKEALKARLLKGVGDCKCYGFGMIDLW